MKNKTLKSIITFCILNVAFCAHINAQIIYMDVNPDKTKNTNGANYKIDLNNDGIKDFKIYVSITAATAQCTGHTDFAVNVTALNSNKVAYTSVKWALKLSANTIIDPNTAWSNSYSFFLRTGTRWANHPSGGCFPLTPWGAWSTSSDGYIGLKLNSAGNVYYGWARLSVTVTNTTASFTIKDYAYDSTPNHSILAGATLGPRIALDNSQDEIADSYQLQVAPNPVSNSTKISFMLEQSQKVSLKIFDLNGRLVTTLADASFEEGDHEITWNAADGNTGIYFLRMETATYSENRKLIVAK